MNDLYNQHQNLMDFIKVARHWQELLLMEMVVYGISTNQIKEKSGFAHAVFNHFCDGIAQPIKIIQLKNTIKHILKERDLQNCQSIGKQSVTYPQAAAFLEDIKRMELYMPWGDEEDFIQAAGHLDQGNKIQKAIADMKELMEQEGIPPIETNVGKREAQRRIDQLTHPAE